MKLPRLAWVIAFLLCLATTLNYLDRQAIGIVSVEIRREFSLTEENYSYIVSAFLFAYAIGYAASGYITDRLGARRGFALFMSGWSLAQLLHGFAIGKWSLGSYRFLLGLMEPGAWPAATKAIAEWFPSSQRAFAMGIFNAGTMFGSALAPVTIALITLRYGWRSAFVATGAAGIVWLVLWLLIYRSPQGKATPEAASRSVDWLGLLRARGCWTLIVTRFLTDPVIYFVIFWLPEYLRRERGFDLAMVGEYSWVPFALGGAGYLIGGWLSGHLMRTGWPVGRARKFSMAVGAAVLPIAIAAPFVPTAALAIAAICALTLGHGIWVANLQTIPTDLFKTTDVGTVTGFSGAGGAIGGALANLGTGWVVMHFSYAPVFLLAGLMHPLSAVLTYVLLPEAQFSGRPLSKLPARSRA
ncbi:MAG TPA: MFS transporter [Bryobacteraceae bacterium]|nr:MFS transporter [Bryobacteraceae bacterium]